MNVNHLEKVLRLAISDAYVTQSLTLITRAICLSDMLHNNNAECQMFSWTTRAQWTALYTEVLEVTLSAFSYRTVPYRFLFTHQTKYLFS